MEKTDGHLPAREADEGDSANRGQRQSQNEDKTDQGTPPAGRRQLFGRAEAKNLPQQLRQVVNGRRQFEALVQVLPAAQSSRPRPGYARSFSQYACRAAAQAAIEEKRKTAAPKTKKK